MAQKNGKAVSKKRRVYDKDFRQEAVQMLLDGHSARSVADRLGLSGANLLYRWKKEVLGRGGPAAASLEARVRQLEEELRRVERERDILKKRWPSSAAADSRPVCRHRADRRRRRLAGGGGVRCVPGQPLGLLRLAS